MIYTSLAVLAMSASAVISPLSKLVHLHPRNAQPDTRVSVLLRNVTPYFQDIKIDGRSYTILGHHCLRVKAPAGTRIVADSSTYQHHRGELVAEIGTQPSDTRIDLKQLPASGPARP